MNEKEKEINLKRLLYKALKHWRVAAVVGIIGAVVIGGTKCTMEMIKIYDPEVLEDRQLAYQGELAAYQQRGEEIRRNIDTIGDSITKQQEYNEKSVLMEIDPYNEWRGSIDFYIETDYKIMPGSTYQDMNIANQIMSVYNTYITNGELYQYIMEHLSTKLEMRYLREVLGFSMESQSYLMHFTVRGASETDCKELLTLIEEGVNAKQAEILENVGQYKLPVTNRATYSQINYELEQSQKNNRQAVTDLNASLAVKQLERIEWKRDEGKIKEPVVTAAGAVKSGIKVAIITAVAAGFVILLFYGIGYLFSRLVQDRDEFDGWGCFVAELPRIYKKRRFQWIDRIISGWFLGSVKTGEYETRLASAAKQIGEAAKISYAVAEPVLVLAGDLPREELEELVTEMQRLKTASGVHFAAAGNPLLEVSAIDAILQADAVVLAVRQEYTKRDILYQIREQIQALKKPLAAVVLTEVEALL